MVNQDRHLFSCLSALITVLTVGVGLPSSAVASDGPGSSAANFLKIGIGGRGAAMGGAQAAVSEDVTASYWNPARLTTLRFQEISLMHYNWVEGITYNQASYGFPTKKQGSFAFGVSYLDYGSIQGFDDGAIPTGNLDATHFLASASWARDLSQKYKLTAGASFKYLKSDLAGFAASAPMVDLGVHYPITAGKLRGAHLAATVRNLGPDVQYDQEGSPLPQQIVLGSGYTALGGNLTLALDLIRPRDTNPYVAAGVEYRIFRLLNLRAGYNGTADFIGTGFTYGLGIHLNQWSFDYAFVPYGVLGDTNRFSVGFRFGHAYEMKNAEDQVEFAYRKAQRLYAQGQALKAYSTLDELLRVAPWHKESVELKAKIEKQFAEMGSSKNEAKLEAQIAEKFTAAKAAFDRDELVDAKKGFEDILKLRPRHVGATVYLERIKNRYASLAQESFKEGMAYFAVGDYTRAKGAFEKTITIDPEHKDAKDQLRKTDEMMVDATKRAEEMRRLGTAAIAYKAGLAAFQANQLKVALEKFEKVQKLAPAYEEVGRYLALTRETYGNILFEQSQVHFENSQLEEAVGELKEARKLIPEDTRVVPALEVAERDLRLRRVHQAKDIHQQAIEAFLSGRTDEAKKLWEKALELDPANEDALENLSKLERMKRDAKPNP